MHFNECKQELVTHILNLISCNRTDVLPSFFFKKNSYYKLYNNKMSSGRNRTYFFLLIFPTDMRLRGII